MNTPDKNTTTAAANALDMATFLGYEDVPLSRPIGDRKAVKVKCLPVRAFAEYAALFALECFGRELVAVFEKILQIALCTFNNI